jgi:hypothetical protein
VNTRTVRLLAGSLLLVVVAACAGAAAPSPTAPGATAGATATGSPATAAPATPGGQRFDIRSAAVEPQACMDALIGGTLARSAQSGLGITGADGTSNAVEWPFGWSASIELGRVALSDETGNVVAREGDQITIGGGFGNQLWYACGPVTVTKAAS